MGSDGRYSRNELLFGADGQKRIAESKVGIVGLGGLGSHASQQLAYLGVLDCILVDDDTVTESSLNRLIGATSEDTNTKKVIIAKSLIENIQPEADVLAIDARLPAAEALEALADRSHIFGCLDLEEPRLRLTEFCTERGIVYIDSASGVDEEDDDEYGGRIITATGDGCLSCLGAIDQNELRREQMTDQQRRVDEKLYGIERGALDQAGPSVVSINGVVASLAINEFMVNVTGMEDPARYVVYRGRARTVGRNRDEPKPDCPFCGRWPKS